MKEGGGLRESPLSDGPTVVPPNGVRGWTPWVGGAADGAFREAGRSLAARPSFDG